MQACIRRYLIHAPDGKAYPIYVEAFSDGGLGQFYDVQATTWTGAPLFADPNQTTRVGSRTYDLFYNGSHLEKIAWRQYGALYWVHNTLTDAVGNGELLAIAAADGADGGRAQHAQARDPQSVLGPDPPAPDGWHTSLRIYRQDRWSDRACPAAARPVRGAAQLERLRALRDHVNVAAASTAVLETQLATAAAGYGPRVAHGAAGYATNQPADVWFAGGAPAPLKRYRSRPRWVRVAIGLGIGLVLAAAAGYLTRQHLHVVEIGNLREPPPVAYKVLYRPGDAGQARLLAAILKAQHPLVAPIDAATAPAIGSTPRLVLVVP